MSHLFHVLSILRLIHSVSYIFCTSRFRPLLNFQTMSWYQALSRNQLSLTAIKKWSSCSRKMYIKVAYLIFSMRLLIQSNTQFILFIDEIFAWHFNTSPINNACPRACTLILSTMVMRLRAKDSVLPYTFKNLSFRSPIGLSAESLDYPNPIMSIVTGSSTTSLWTRHY